MLRPGQLSRGAQAARLARGAADWLLDSSGADLGDASLYHGLAGVVLALHEAHQHFGDDRYRLVVERGSDALSAQVDGLEGCSLYFGLAGVAVALRALGRDAAADRALDRVRDRFDGQRWNQMFELFMGNAGIGVTVDHAGARWSNHEHRACPSDLAPRAGWAMGNVGIIRELLRYARLSERGAAGYAVPWPDHPVTGNDRPAPYPTM